MGDHGALGDRRSNRKITRPPVRNFETPYYPSLDSDALIAGPSRSQDWYLDPSPEECAEQYRYQESTLLDTSGNHFVDPHALHTEHVYCGFNTS